MFKKKIADDQKANMITNRAEIKALKTLVDKIHCLLRKNTFSMCRLPQSTDDALRVNIHLPVQFSRSVSLIIVSFVPECLTKLLLSPSKVFHLESGIRLLSTTLINNKQSKIETFHIFNFTAVC